MNKLIRSAMKEALTESVAEIIAEIDAGEFDIVHIECTCGHNEHAATASYCGYCGKKLERAAANDSL